MIKYYKKNFVSVAIHVCHSDVSLTKCSDKILKIMALFFLFEQRVCFNKGLKI
jgi:hypothetical protein